MSEAATTSDAETAATPAAKKSWLDGASRTVVITLAGLAIVAVVGIAEGYSARSNLAAMQERLAAAGFDASSLDTLDRAIAAKQRELVRVENALVSKSAAAGARDAQIASAAARLGTVETAAAEALAAEREASALHATLSAENRSLSRRVSELSSSAVSWEAAANARRQELDGLIGEVETNAAIVADVAMWKARGAELTAAENRLAREVVGMENQLVALKAAVDFRQKQVAEASVAFSAAESAERMARVNTLELRAEAERLTRSIASLTDENARIAKELVALNNRFIPAVAAVKVREDQLQKLAVSVQQQEETNRALAAANADMQARMAVASTRIAQITKAATQASELLMALDQVLEEPVLQAALDK